ncbi:hypothetical protein ACFYP0_31820 [Micromonospora arida]|uniref:hypothetical protein n=1 Tax=Micromonospora arida TaxID=2203715 RepID=UPI0036CCCC92
MAAPRMAPPSGMSRRLTFLFALAAGVAVGNLYWAQPLLGFIAGDLRVTTATAGWLAGHRDATRVRRRRAAARTAR